MVAKSLNIFMSSLDLSLEIVDFNSFKFKITIELVQSDSESVLVRVMILIDKKNNYFSEIQTQISKC